jgi:hypothetical protein
VLGPAPTYTTIPADAHEGPVYVRKWNAVLFTSVPATTNVPLAGDRNVFIGRLDLDSLKISTFVAATDMANGMTLDREGHARLPRSESSRRPAGSRPPWRRPVAAGGRRGRRSRPELSIGAEQSISGGAEAMATTYSGPTRVAGGFLVRDDALRRPRDRTARPRDQLGGGIELTGEDSNGEMWGATIYGPNTADPVVKGAVQMALASSALAGPVIKSRWRSERRLSGSGRAWQRPGSTPRRAMPAGRCASPSPRRRGPACRAS